MIGRIDRPRRRVLVLVGGALLLALVLFGVGSAQTNKALEALAAAGREAEDLVDCQISQIDEWAPRTESEAQAWTWLASKQDSLLSRPNARFSVPAALTRLADREGLHGVSLVEMSSEELEWTVLEIDQSARINRRSDYEDDYGSDDDYDDYDDYDEYGDDLAERAMPALLTEHGFKIRFKGRYASLMRFLKGLDTIPSLVVMRKAVIQRGVPDLTAELVLVAYEEGP